MNCWKTLILGLVSLLLPFAQAWANNPAGAITKTRGVVEISRDAAKLDAKKGVELFVQDRVQTGPRGLLVASMKDESRIVLGNSASMVVEALSYQENAENNEATLEVTKGAFRFVSGLAAKANPESTKLKLGKLATIGVRGTHFGGVVSDNDAKVMLLKPVDGSDRPTAIIVSNDLGSVTIDTPGQGTTLLPNQPPSAPEPMDLPVLSCPMFN